MPTPFFSVMIPVYKAEPYLRSCLESLLRQDFSDYEVVLVDDGSPDGCGAICDEYQQRYPDMFRVIHQENRGVVLARAAAFRAARGEYLLSVDADDLLREDAMGLLHSLIREHEADMVIFNCSEKEDFSQPFFTHAIAPGEVVNIETSEKLRLLAGSTFQINNLSCRAVHRSLVDTQRDYTDLAYLREGEDLIMGLPMVDAAQRILFSREVLYYYRPNPNSLTHTYHPLLFPSVKQTLQIQRFYAEKWDRDGSLTEAADTNGLRRFYDVIARICLSRQPFAQKRKFLLQVVNDEDFLRDYRQLGRMTEKKVLLSLWLAKHRVFAPLFLYGALK